MVPTTVQWILLSHFLYIIPTNNTPAVSPYQKQKQSYSPAAAVAASNKQYRQDVYGGWVWGESPIRALEAQEYGSSLLAGLRRQFPK